MPAFEDLLSDDEIAAVTAFIKSTWLPHIRQQQQRINEDWEERAVSHEPFAQRVGSRKRQAAKPAERRQIPSISSQGFARDPGHHLPVATSLVDGAAVLRRTCLVRQHVTIGDMWKEQTDLWPKFQHRESGSPVRAWSSRIVQ
jgi:hypothetical protein